LSTRQMRIGAATSKKDMGAQQTYATNGKSFRDHFRVFFSEFIFVLFCTWPTSYAISLFFLDDCVLLRIFSF
jgi:hypothetical protein